MLHRNIAVALIAWTVHALAGAAPLVTFADSTFDLSGYTVSTYLGPGQTVAVTQTTQGNPGTALEVDVVIPPPGFFNAGGRALVLSNSFVYDPGVSGAIASIDWSVDKYTKIITPPNFGLFNGATLLMVQDGKFFLNVVGLASTQEEYLQASAQGLGESDFFELLDPLLGTVNVDSHPDFAGGAMQFGLSASWGSPAGAPTAEIVGRYDNLFVALAVPEPSEALMLVLGLALLAGLQRRGAQR